MKKFWVLITFVLLASCGSLLTSTEEITKNNITGNWKLSAITFNESNTIQKEIFDVFTINCLESSLWEFDTETNSVVFINDKLNCTNEEKKYTYYSKKINANNNSYDLILKPSNNKKSKGFRFKLEKISNSFMQWQIIKTIDNQEKTTYLNFIKF